MHVRVRYLDLHTGTVYVHVPVPVVVLVVGSTRTTAVRTTAVQDLYRTTGTAAPPVRLYSVQCTTTLELIASP